MNLFAQRLKELRKEKRLTQTEVAEFLGITPRGYHYYESAEREVSLDNLVKIADYFCVTTDYLLGRSDER